jgi:hypothetical protein
VAHTAEQRDRHNLCGAKKKNGKLCRKFAGEGTDHLGWGRCKYHLGNTPAHKKHAIAQEAKRRAVAFGEPVDIDAGTALIAVLQLSAGHLAWLRYSLSFEDDKTSHNAQVLLRMYDDERDRVARIAKAALDAGVAERQVRLAERVGAELAEVLGAVFDDAALALTQKQRARLPEVLRRHLTALDGPPALPSPA